MKQLTLLQINDTHGYLEPHSELFWRGTRAEYRSAGGFARIQSIFKKVRAEQNGAVVALDNGDTFHGTYHAVQSQGRSMLAPLNLLNLDAWTAHWDFAYGPDTLRELAGQLNYPLLASNCYRQETGELEYPASIVIVRAGVRIGIIGIAATIIDKTMPEHFSEGLCFTLGNQELPGHIKTLREREGVDLIVVLSHLGFPQDVKLASEIGGIDVLLSGHTHHRMEKPAVVNGAVIIQSGCHGSFVGRLDLELDRGNVRVLRHELIRKNTDTPAGTCRCMRLMHWKTTSPATHRSRRRSLEASSRCDSRPSEFTDNSPQVDLAMNHRIGPILTQILIPLLIGAALGWVIPARRWWAGGRRATARRRTFPARCAA